MQIPHVNSEDTPLIQQSSDSGQLYKKVNWANRIVFISYTIGIGFMIWSGVDSFTYTINDPRVKEGITKLVLGTATGLLHCPAIWALDELKKKYKNKL